MALDHVLSSLAVGASMGAVSLALQVPALTGAATDPITVPVVSAIVGAAMSYAVLRTTVQRIQADLDALKRDVHDVSVLIRESLVSSAHIKGQWDQQQRNT